MERNQFVRVVSAISLVLLIAACGGSDSQSPQAAGSAPPVDPLIASTVLLEVDIKKSGEQLSLEGTHVKQTATPSKPYPVLAGDYAIFVLGPENKLQYVTMFSFTGSDRALGEGIDPATGKKFGIYVDLSRFPASRVLPINAETEEVYVLDKDKKRVLDIPFDKGFVKSLLQKSSFLKTTSPVAQLLGTYPNIKFGECSAYWNMCYPLSDSSIAQNLINGLDPLRDRSILLGVDSIYIISGPVDFWATLEGAHYDHKLYLVEDSVLGDHLPELIAHEGAHAYIQLLEEAGAVPVSQYEDEFADMTDIIFFFSSKWTEIKKKWYDLQKGYQEKRSLSACSDTFVSSEYEYGEVLLPSSSDKNPTVDNFFEHGFVSPYASADVGEDIAETFTFALFSTDLLSRKVKKDNIFDQKLSLLKDLGMLTESDYAQLTPAGDAVQPSVVLLEFRYKGIQVKPLYFVLNAIDISPSFSGSGEYAHEIGKGETLIQNTGNKLFLATAIRNTDGDYDDIEVEKLRLTSPLPIDPETGCDSTLTYLDAPEPVHLGDNGCSADIYCSSYTALEGTSCTWAF